MGLVREWMTAIFPGANRRAEFRKNWGAKGDKDGWLASRAFDHSRTPSSSRWLGDKSWVDLEMPALFKIIDTTVSPIGSQVLFKQLREYRYGDSNDEHEKMNGRYEAYDAFKDNRDLREECQVVLTGLDTNSAAHIADLILGKRLSITVFRSLAYVLAIASVATLGGAVAFGLSLWWWIAVIFANTVFVAGMSSRVGRDLDGLLSCWTLLNVADRLSLIEAGKQLALFRQLREEQPKRTLLRRSIRWLAIVSSDNSPLAGLGVLLNIVFLTKLIAYFTTADKFDAYREHWKSTFELVGSIDATIAIANFLHRMPRHCRPTLSDKSLISFSDLYHPLIDQPVRSSVTLNERSALVTGSNMTGKTTFVKAMALNIVLGNTIGICLADAATVPRSGVMTSIRNEHSVESGKSHYLAEVETIQRMLLSAESGDCRIFAIDEPFSGTNTVERIAIARALLSALGRNAQVLVTTHDVELQHPLAHAFDLFHFREDPNVEGFFDYQLRSGASVEQNAIKVLARMGFPGDVVQQAFEYAEQSRQTG